MDFHNGQGIGARRSVRNFGLAAGSLLCLSLALFAAPAKAAKTYPSCGTGSDSSCIVGSGFGAVFDGKPGNSYKLCVTPSGRDRDCKRFVADGKAYFFRGGESYELSEGPGYSFIYLTGISYEPTCEMPYETGRPCGHMTLRWYKDGRKIDRDRLTLLVGD